MENRAPSASNLRKTCKITVIGPQNEVHHMTHRTKNISKNHFLRWGCWRGNVVLFCSFCVNAARRCHFRTFCHNYAITKKKRKKPKFPRQQRNDENQNFPTGYWVGRAGWSSVSWAYGRLGWFLVCFNYKHLQCRLYKLRGAPKSTRFRIMKP